MPLVLFSPAFSSGKTLPSKYTCDGENVSPPLIWKGIPDGCRSLVLIVDDVDMPTGAFSHWILYDIPPEIHELSEAVPSDNRLCWGGANGRNDLGTAGYDGPCPPDGFMHTYYFRLYALNENLDLPPGATRRHVIERMRNHILDNTELLARYKHVG